MKLEHTNEALKVFALAALILGFALTLPGCGPGRIVRGPGSACTVTKDGGVATISCPDGSTTTISDGATGANGSDGQDGSNGHSAIASQSPATSCANGGTTISLGVDLNDNGQLDSDEVTQTITVCNGTNGQDGNNGNSGHGNNGNHYGQNKD